MAPAPTYDRVPAGENLLQEFGGQRQCFPDATGTENPVTVSVYRPVLRRHLARFGAAILLVVVLVASWRSVGTAVVTMSAQKAETVIKAGALQLSESNSSSSEQTSQTTQAKPVTVEPLVLRSASPSADFIKWSDNQVCQDELFVVQGFGATGLLESWEACATACIRDVMCEFFAWRTLPIRACWHFWACKFMDDAEMGLALYRKLWNDTRVFEEDTIVYIPLENDVWCAASEPLLNDFSPRASYTALYSFDACKASCNALPDCNIFLWKDSPASVARYHCALFSECSMKVMYWDTQPNKTQLFQKSKGNECKGASSVELALPIISLSEDAYDLNLFMLVIDTPLSKKRQDHFFNHSGQPAWLTSNITMVKGISMLDYESRAQLSCEQTLAPLSLATIQQSLWSLPTAYTSQAAVKGVICCSVGHIAIWRQAVTKPGWSVILEDDALLQRNMTKQELLGFILEHQINGIVNLEGRGCYKNHGSTAYALTAEKAAELLLAYNISTPVDVFLWQTHDPQSRGPLNQDGSCPPVSLWPFNGWGVVPDRPGDTATMMSEIVGAPLPRPT